MIYRFLRSTRITALPTPSAALSKLFCLPEAAISHRISHSSSFLNTSLQHFFTMSTQMAAQAQDEAKLTTRILPIHPMKLGEFTTKESDMPLEEWDLALDMTTQDGLNLKFAADQLRNSDIPVAFPTETVYGLGADATRSAAVKGIYHAKQRPSDNPLIVHIASLSQLRRLLSPGPEDPIPEIYHPLIRRFWPGPLTIILPNPENSKLAPEVTAGLSTFGARMPRNLLALALIRLADVPVAAPSANASTKPSPTAAEHVKHDLDGRIELIVDGGLCDIGVESTVVDGTCSPPAILRPGGIGLDQIRQVPGWENTVVGYKDVSEKGGKPRAPGMKYRHYSPKAPVLLVEAGGRQPSVEDVARYVGASRTIGVVRTKTWKCLAGEKTTNGNDDTSTSKPMAPQSAQQTNPITTMLHETQLHERLRVKKLNLSAESGAFSVWDICIGPDTQSIARGLFSSLRDLDLRNVDTILVEGIRDEEGDVAAAVMNRLRKAAEVKVGML